MSWFRLCFCRKQNKLTKGRWLNRILKTIPFWALKCNIVCKLWEDCLFSVMSQMPSAEWCQDLKERLEETTHPISNLPERPCYRWMMRPFVISFETFQGEHGCQSWLLIKRVTPHPLIPHHVIYPWQPTVSIHASRNGTNTFAHQLGFGFLLLAGEWYCFAAN